MIRAPNAAVRRLVTRTRAGSRLVEFDGVGHNGPVTAADRVTPTVREFLDEQLATV